MTDTDIMMLSIFFNIILLFNSWLMHKRYNLLGELFAKSVVLMGAIADGKVKPHRDSKGDIHMKDLRKEQSNGN
jgi:hypothetical protein